MLAQNSGAGVRAIAFIVNPLIPIVVGISAFLRLDLIEIRILSRGLIEMSMNSEVPNHTPILFEVSVFENA
jgi:hypothetical protein